MMSETIGPCPEGLFSGLLPLKLNTGLDGRELDRARLLLSSIQYHWKGKRPFALHVVGRDDEMLDIVEGLRRFRSRNVQLMFHAETALFPADSPFHVAPGMYKQQLIKLFAARIIGRAAFVTLDADVICVKDFDEQSFMRSGRIVSHWEKRDFHAWWRNSEAVTGCRSDERLYGIGVTPNTLHADLCLGVERLFSLRRLDAAAYLCEVINVEKHPGLTTFNNGEIPLAWSEYSLYTLASEWTRELYQYHVTPAEAQTARIEVHSRRNVWSASDITKLSDEREEAYFLVVQSWAGISIEEIRRLLRFPF